MPRGDNLRLGQKDGDRGRRKGGRARAARQNQAPRDWPCPHCERMGYTLKVQCWGHQGFSKIMQDNPSALHSLYEKVGRTGRADSSARWAEISR